MKRDKTRIIALIIAVAITLSVLVPAVIWITTPAFASSSKLTEEQTLANEAKENKNKAQKERAELEAKNKELNKEIEALANDINALNSDIYEKEQQIKANENRIKELDEEIEKNDELLKTRLRVMYEQGTMSYIEILFSSGGFSDMLLRFEMVTQLYEHDMKLIDELNQNRTEAKEAKEKIESDKEKIVEERDVLLEKQAVFDSKVSENNSQVAKLKEDEAYYAKMQKEHEQAAQAILNEINASKSGSSGSTATVVSSGSGKLGLPCYEGAHVTSEFGSRILRGQPNYHTGIDFAVSTGTPVLAAADGVVLASGWRGSYGNCVTIDHGDMVTLYAHNSALNVTAGQRVVRGQQIAAAGSTGNSTGPHIHFSVIINGQYVNPRPYLW